MEGGRTLVEIAKQINGPLIMWFKKYILSLDSEDLHMSFFFFLPSLFFVHL